MIIVISVIISLLAIFALVFVYSACKLSSEADEQSKKYYEELNKNEIHKELRYVPQDEICVSCGKRMAAPNSQICPECKKILEE